MDTNRFQDQNVLITGGSSGIGLATAKEFAQLGANLYLLARDPDKLEKAKNEIQPLLSSGRHVETITADVGDRDRIEEAVHQVGHSEKGLHTIINNAGTGFVERLENSSVEELDRVMQVNYWAAVHALKAGLSYIKKADKGHIGFVSSVGGYLGLLGYNSYCPSKFALTGLAECVRMEAKELGIGTTIVFPPDTDTPLWHYEQEHTLPECKAFTKKVKLMSPEAVAKKFVQAILKYRFEVLCNSESKTLRFLKATFPRYYYNMLDGIVEKDRKKRKKATSAAVPIDQ